MLQRLQASILNGANETLRETALLLIETSNFRLGSESLRFHGMCSLMDKRGFRIIDISFWRLKDKSFCQVDLFFLSKDRQAFKYAHYK